MAHLALTNRSTKLLDLITTTVAPESWDETGGPGSIREFDGVIVVAQMANVHDQIRKLLRELRAMRGPAAEGVAASRPVDDR